MTSIERVLRDGRVADQRMQAHSGVVQAETAQEEARLAFADHPLSDSIGS